MASKNPLQFLNGEETSIDNISKNVLKNLDAPALPLSSKHNLSHLLPADLLRVSFIWLR
jgi:hypothetical protein